MLCRKILFEIMSSLQITDYWNVHNNTNINWLTDVHSILFKKNFFSKTLQIFIKAINHTVVLNHVVTLLLLLNICISHLPSFNSSVVYIYIAVARLVVHVPRIQTPFTAIMTMIIQGLLLLNIASIFKHTVIHFTSYTCSESRLILVAWTIGACIPKACLIEGMDP